MKTIEEMERELKELKFFTGGLTDEGIKYYYRKHILNHRIFYGYLGAK